MNASLSGDAAEDQQEQLAGNRETRVVSRRIAVKMIQ